MIGYAPNISWLFPELEFTDRPRAVFQAGFDAFEFGFFGAVNLDAIVDAQHEFGLKVVLINMDMSVWDEANRGYLSDPDRGDEFRRALDAALEVAVLLRASKLWVPAGARLEKVSDEVQLECAVENLIYAAPLAEQADVMLNIEVINPGDIPNYWLDSSRRAVEIVKAVDHANVKFQFDTYHLQMLEDNLTKILTEHIDAIGHIQFGDAPGRTEPGWGTLDFAALDAAVVEAGYEGYIGLEYQPVSEGAATFAWVPENRRRRQAR